MLLDGRDELLHVMKPGTVKCWHTRAAPVEDTVRKYVVKPRKPCPASTTWLTFLGNHLDCSWAMDFFTVTTLRFQVLSAFLFFDHARREVVHFAVTSNPTMKSVIQQPREARPFGCQPRYSFRDNHSIFGHGVRAFLISCGILEARTAYRSPWPAGEAGGTSRQSL